MKITAKLSNYTYTAQHDGGVIFLRGLVLISIILSIAGSFFFSKSAEPLKV